MEDEHYSALQRYLEFHEYPSGYNKNQKYVLKRSSKSYTLRGQQLFYLDKRADKSIFQRIVIKGREEAERVFSECHLSTGGHRGRDATTAKIKDRYYWPNYYKEVEEKIKLCDRCQRNATQLKSPVIELNPIAVEPKVWHLVGMDLIGPFQRSPEGHHYVLTATDYFTKYVEVVPIENKSAISVARGIFKVYCRQGAPVHLICDQGKEFINELNEKLQKIFDVKMRISSPYHPQTNGLDERTNQTLKRSLCKLMENTADDWSQYLDSAVFSINTSIQSTTKFTPFRMMFGREARFLLEAEKEGAHCSPSDIANSLCKHDTDSLMERVFQKQQAVFQSADERIKNAQVKQKEQYLKRRGIFNHKFEDGDKVLRRNMKQKTCKGHKSEDKWHGPYTIVDKTKTSCRLKNKTGKCLKTRINLNQLKPYLLHHPSQDSPVPQVDSTINATSNCGDIQVKPVTHDPPSKPSKKLIPFIVSRKPYGDTTVHVNIRSSKCTKVSAMSNSDFLPPSKKPKIECLKTETDISPQQKHQKLKQTKLQILATVAESQCAILDKSTLSGGIPNKENSCWLISLLQLLNASQFDYYLSGMDMLNEIQTECCNIFEKLKEKKVIDILNLRAKLAKQKMFAEKSQQHDTAEALFESLCQNIPESKVDELFTLSYLTKSFCEICNNGGSNEFEDVEVEKFFIVYCALGKSRESITVNELVILNHNLGVIAHGPKERCYSNSGTSDKGHSGRGKTSPLVVLWTTPLQRTKLGPELCNYCEKSGGVKVTSELRELPKYLYISFKRTVVSVSGPPRRASRPVIIQRKINFTQKNGDAFQYNLQGFIVHHGNTTVRGHYTAYLLYEGNILIHYNDSDVSQVNISDINDLYIQRNVTMLLYSSTQLPVHVLQLDKPENCKKPQDDEEFMFQFAEKDMTSTSCVQQLQSSLCHLNPGQWLNDVIINSYFRLISQDKVVKVSAASTFFATSLRCKGYQAAKKYLREPNFFKKDLILFPWNIANSHWILMVLKPQDKILMCMDSLQGSHHEVENLLWHYICKLGEEMKVTVHQSMWRRWDSKMGCMPLQKSNVDCGVYICMAARLMVFQKIPTFSQKDIPYFREVMKQELLHGKLANIRSGRNIQEQKDQHSSEESGNDESDKSTSEEETLIPLKDIQIPQDFLLPEFSVCTDKPVEHDIFADHRSVKTIWVNRAKAYIRGCIEDSVKSDSHCIFQRKFIRQVLKTNEKKWKDIVKGSVPSKYTVNPSKNDRRKITLQWPLELNEMGFEIEIYLKAIESEVRQRKALAGFNVAKFILFPEAMVLLIKERFNIKIEDARNIYDKEDSKALRDLITASY